MKKLLLLSSITLLFCQLAFTSCKSYKERREAKEKTAEVEEVEIQNRDLVVPAPGTIDQRRLDSIKRVRTLEKTKPVR